MDFKYFFEHIDASQIDHLYDKAHIAIEIVQMYNPAFLNNITTIADLASGAYGLYNSGENRKTLPQEVEKRLIYWGRIKKEQIGLLPAKTLRQYFPELNPHDIRIGETIHINVRRILSQSKSDLDAVLQIASTVIHEAQHAIEKESTGTTSETGPKTEEHKFMQWTHMNLPKVLQKYPQLRLSQV